MSPVGQSTNVALNPLRTAFINHQRQIANCQDAAHPSPIVARATPESYATRACDVPHKLPTRGCEMQEL
jgi:hypothetical protein